MNSENNENIVTSKSEATPNKGPAKDVAAGSVERATMVSSAADTTNRQTVIKAPKNTDVSTDNRQTVVKTPENASVSTDNRQTVVRTPGSSPASTENRQTVVKTSDDANRSTKIWQRKQAPDGAPLESAEDLLTKVAVGDIVEGYKVGKLLTDASGESKIHLCEKDGKTYVIKVYNASYKPNEDVFKQLQAISSPYIMKAITSGFHKTRYFEITHYYKNGTLLDRIDKLDDVFLKTVVVHELNEALKALHDKDIVHNDIKPHNIFITDDQKHIVLGDFGISVFLAGRDYVMKPVMALTHMYAAPEAAESSSKATDYYSMGMSLLHLGFKEDPFKGISNLNIRMKLLNYGQNIPEKIDPQLGDLIAKLIKFNPGERPNYEGVKRWLLDPEVYHGARLSTAVQNVTLDEPYDFRKVRYTNLIELTEAMGAEWDWALRNIENGFVESIFRRNVDLRAEIKSHQPKLTVDEYLFYVLSFLNPSVSFRYKNLNFGNFEGYIEYLRTHYSDKSDLLVTKELVKIELRATKKADAMIQLFESIWDAPVSTQTKVDLLINYFTNSPGVYSAGKVYESLEDFAKKAFDDNFGYNVSHCLLLRSPLFINLLSSKFSIPLETFQKKLQGLGEVDTATSEKTAKNKIPVNQDFLLLASFSKIILGYVPVKFEGRELKTIDEFVLLAKERYEKRISVDKIGQFIKEGYLSLYVSLYEDVSSREKDIIRQLSGYSENLENTGICFYLVTADNAVFHLDGTNTFADLGDVFTYLNAKKDLAMALDKLRKIDLFFQWMKFKGYDISAMEGKK